MPTFSEWLQTQMESQGVGQRELAQKVGVGQNAVKAWVLGGNVSWHNCRAIADALGASREYVRQLAGYIDPEDEPAPQSDPETRELVAIYGDLNQRGREALFEVARALRQTQRRSGRNGRARGAG
jgi:transcriptional regulator with XRE-family HTH domain